MIDIGRDLERMRDYVAGRLSDVEQRAFEDRLTRDPELVRELELSQRLREGLERLRDGGLLPVAERRQAPRRWAWGAGLAATLAAAALLLWLQPGERAPAVPLLSASAPAAGTAARLTLIAMRGDSARATLVVPARGVVELRASRAAAAAGARYRVALARVGGGGARVTVGELGGLAAAADGLVYVYAEAAGLAAGEYELRVAPDGESAAGAGVFAFSVRGPAR